MELNTIQFEKFKNLLDLEHTWPSLYTFKFVVKECNLAIAQQIFAEENLVLKGSKTGKYISISLTREMNSSDEIIAIYKRATLIPGVIAL